MSKINQNTLVTIGIPIYNGEEFLKEGLECVLSQSYKNLEIIIGDNGSTDNTYQICKEYSEKDNRIKYFRHEQNIGHVKNFEFVLSNASGKYFLWKAIDDLLDSTFLEKCIPYLSNEEIACSLSQVEYYGEKTVSLKINETDSKINKIKKKIICYFSPLHNVSTNDTYQKKIRQFLKIRGHHHLFYGIYRTVEIKKQFVNIHMVGFDLATMLNILKVGDFHVKEEVLMKRYDGGMSASGFFNLKKSSKWNYFEAIFFYMPFTKWCLKNLGARTFAKNIDCIFVWNLEGIFYLGVDILRKTGMFKIG